MKTYMISFDVMDENNVVHRFLWSVAWQFRESICQQISDTAADPSNCFNWFHAAMVENQVREFFQFVESEVE